MKQLFLLTIILHIIAFNVSSQNQNIQQKYWKYRQRFLEQFIAKNTDSPTQLGMKGTNIPAGHRHLWMSSSTDNGQRRIVWGDATIYLSYYISVLATEYALLSRNGENVNETKNLLIAALNTFNRLDATAESYYRSNGLMVLPFDLNGFYIRDDVPIDFLTNPNYTEYSGHLSFLDYTNVPIEDLRSSFADHAPPDIDPPSPYSKECSQDQGWHLLLSLDLVKHLVPESEYGDFWYYGHITIKSMVMNISKRIVTAMQSYIHIPIPFTDNYIVGDKAWILRNPANQQDVSDHREGAGRITEVPEWLTSTFVSYGGMAYAFGEAGSRISEEDCHYDNSENQKWQFKGGLNGLSYYDANNYHNGYNHLCLATIIGGVMEDSNDETFKFLLKVVKMDHHYFEHLPLIFSLLHGQTDMHEEMFDLKLHCQDLLNNAPDCGPYRYNLNEYGHTDWTSPNRLYQAQGLIQILVASDNPNEYKNFAGVYNGLDYMLLHNLYQLVYGSTDVSENLVLNAPTFNIPYVVPNLPFPMVMIIGDSPTNQFTAQAQNEIFASNTITYSVNPSTNATFVGYANYVAGKSIHLTTGFHAMAGSHFRAYIDNSLYYHKFETADLYSCGGIPSVGVMAYQAPDSTQNQHYIFPVEMQNTEEVGFEPQQQNQPNEHRLGSLQNLELVATHGGLAENATEQAQSGTSNGANGTAAIQSTSSPAYSVSVFPNPSTGRFVVQINGTVPANVTVELRDLLGKSVYRNLLTSSSNSIDLTGSASGIYFITVCAGKDCWLGKVVKE